MTDWDRIASSAPVDALAARQTAQGDHWVPKRIITDIMHDTCPEVVSDAWMTAHVPNMLNFTDLRGKSFGRLKVIGLSAAIFTGGRKRWVCRCACGHFVNRRGSVLREGKSTECGECHHVIALRESSHFRGAPR